MTPQSLPGVSKYSSGLAKELDVWVKEHEELHPERAAMLADVHHYLVVLIN